MVTMRDDRTHPLLAQVPLTVSPFVTLPTAATLPYTYKSMPSTLPPPSTGITGATDEKPKYVVSPSGHAAHPDDIVASCQGLRAHIAKLQEDADRELHALDERIRARDLAEKRRLAPGWLDSEARLLEPERKPETSPGEPSVAGQFAEMSISGREGVSEMAVDQGEEIDRAFGRK
ncbi:hypothetical protein FHL15_011150 [Xylaria flabelliformis]|uniref:Uncharacterized protein n=1 Tax=Xylaria flabelliformis TaxID=2512241 RepID=A0A553HJ23_9PEZI|nr:hypothetical protein FHL15_011150 [Xylaria flabelliformis]